MDLGITKQTSTDIPNNLKAQKHEYYICPICYAHFAFEDEANRCVKKHSDNNLKVDFERFTDFDPFPERIVLKDLETNKVEIYISREEFNRRIHNLKYFY